MNDISELRATRAVTLGALRVMMGRAEARGGEYLSAEEEQHFIMGCAKVDELDTQIRAAKRSADYWRGLLAHQGAPAQEAWIPPARTMGGSLGISDPTKIARSDAQVLMMRRAAYAGGAR